MLISDPPIHAILQGHRKRCDRDTTPYGVTFNQRTGAWAIFRRDYIVIDTGATSPDGLLERITAHLRAPRPIECRHGHGDLAPPADDDPWTTVWFFTDSTAPAWKRRPRHVAAGFTTAANALLDAIAAPSRPANDADSSWRDQLAMAKNGEGIRKVLANLLLIIEHDERLSGIAYDQFRQGIVKRSSMPWPTRTKLGPWVDEDDTRLAAWIFTEFGIEFATGTVFGAVKAVAHERAFSPVRDYLNGLQ